MTLARVSPIAHVAGSAQPVAVMRLADAPATHTRLMRHAPSTVLGASAVLALHLFGGPSTVRGFVPLRVVDAVDGVVNGRTRTHVSQEVIKGLPALAYSDVAVVARVSWATDPLLHGLPASVGRRAEIAVRRSGFRSRSTLFVTKAATTLDAAISQQEVRDDRALSTGASAFDALVVPVNKSRLTDNDKSAPSRSDGYAVDARHV